jgi:uncharacterized protein YjbJ (UPF0337 family)
MSTRKHGFQMRPDNPPFPDDRPRQRSGDVVDLEPDKLVMRLAPNEGATARFLRFLHFPECFVRLWPIAQYEISKGINLIPMPRYLLEMANHLEFSNRRWNMNKDQVKGTAKDITGKVEEEAGRAVGSKEHEAKGLGKQVTGKAQKKYGDAKEAVKDAADDL